MKSGKNTALIILIIILLALVSILVYLYIPFETVCGMENCNGLDITCGSNTPKFCTKIYQAGDKCRAYASCEIVKGKCELIKRNGFDECKFCVEACINQFSENSTILFQCEARCMS